MSSNLPTVSIITPTLNQGRYIQQTVESVLSQDYPYIEYIIVDGGSTDETEKILSKYKKYIKYIRKKDSGQTNAINNGLKMARGEIVTYLNSDDYYQPQALNKVTKYFIEHDKAMWLTGLCHIVDEKNTSIRGYVSMYKDIFLKYMRTKYALQIVQYVSQPATFWRRCVHQDIGYFDENLHYTMDYDFWMRLYGLYALHFIDDTLANFRVHKNSKTGRNPRGQFEEEYFVAKRYTNSAIKLLLHKLNNVIAFNIYRLGNNG